MPQYGDESLQCTTAPDESLLCAPAPYYTPAENYAQAENYPAEESYTSAQNYTPAEPAENYTPAEMPVTSTPAENPFYGMYDDGSNMCVAPSSESSPAQSSLEEPDSSAIQPASDTIGATMPGTGMGDLRIAEARQRDFDDWKNTPEGSRAGPNEEAAKRIGLQYAHTYAKHTPDEKLGDLSSPEDRDRALNMITQDGISDDLMTQHQCAAASLIGGVMYAEGPAGVSELIAHMESYNDPKAPKDPQIEAIKKKLAANGKDLTLADMQIMQDSLYNTLKYKMERADMNQVQTDPEKLGGVDGSTIKQFIQSDPKMAKMFLDHHMTINHIDNDGDGSGDHFTLGVHGEHGDLQKVYDPLQRDGGQMITQDWALHDYTLASKLAIKPDEHL